MTRNGLALLLLICAGACSHANKNTETAADHSKRSPETSVYVAEDSSASRDGRDGVVPPQRRERGEMATTGAIPDNTPRDNAANVPPPSVGVTSNSDMAADGSDPKVSPMDQSESEGDVKLTQEVRKSIISKDALSFSAKNVTVVTRGGNVTLRGTVPSAREKNLLIETAKSCAGVLHVVDQLEVSK